MEENKGIIDQAVETYDHLLWECIAKACGVAYSKSFSKKGNKVRVVYKVAPGEDPREPGRFQLIKNLVQEYINWELPIIKLTVSNRVAGTMKYYQEYAKQISAKSNNPFVEVVVIGPVHFSQIICPCNGRHLSNTRELKNFKVKLFPPERKGKDTYEFRFEVAKKLIME